MKNKISNLDVKFLLTTLTDIMYAFERSKCDFYGKKKDKKVLARMDKIRNQLIK